MASPCKPLFCYFAISCCLLLASFVPAWGQSRSDFSDVHFDGTFVHLGQHILDTSDIGVLLQRTNRDYRNLTKSNGEDLSWDSDGVRYIQEAKNLKITWVIDSNFLHSMGGHPTHFFGGKLSIFDLEIVRNQVLPKSSLSKCGFKPGGDQASRYYQLDKNGWKIKIFTDRDQHPEAVTLEHSLSLV
jgi:hypothetical protein